METYEINNLGKGFLVKNNKLEMWLVLTPADLNSSFFNDIDVEDLASTVMCGWSFLKGSKVAGRFIAEYVNDEWLVDSPDFVGVEFKIPKHPPLI